MSLMSWFHRWVHRWVHRARSTGRLATGFIGRDRQDADLADELDFHVAKATERNVRRGMSPDEARRAALAVLGGRTHWIEQSRDEQRSRLIEDFTRDVRYGANALRRTPGFAVSAVLTIGLGIAATTTVFSFIDTVYLRPLPVPEGQRLVRIYGGDRPEFDRQLGFPAYQVLRGRTRSFDLVTAHYSTAPLYLTSRAESSEELGAVVSAEYFPMLGVRPVLGRFFTSDEDRVPDRDDVAVIGYGLWRRRFGGDPGVIGEHVTINTRVFTIIGVAPPNFEGVTSGWVNELWIATMMLHAGYRWCDALQRTCPTTSIMARLAPGVSLGSARAELSGLRRTPASAYVAFWQSGFEPQIDARVAIRGQGDPAQLFPPIGRALEAVDVAVPVTETITMDAQRRSTYTEPRLGGAVLSVGAALALFLSAVGLYGVVSFVVARRAKEVGIRLAVGAQPREVVGLFVRQGLRPMWVGAVLGLALSIALAPLLARWLFGIAPVDVPRSLVRSWR